MDRDKEHRTSYGHRFTINQLLKAGYKILQEDEYNALLDNGTRFRMRIGPMGASLIAMVLDEKPKINRPIENLVETK